MIRADLVPVALPLIVNLKTCHPPREDNVLRELKDSSRLASMSGPSEALNELSSSSTSGSWNWTASIKTLGNWLWAWGTGLWAW